MANQNSNLPGIPAKSLDGVRWRVVGILERALKVLGEECNSLAHEQPVAPPEERMKILAYRQELHAACKGGYTKISQLCREIDPVGTLPTPKPKDLH